MLMFHQFERLFITDLDGTLLTDSKRISPQDMNRLQRLKSEKIGIAVATGRSLFSFHRLLLGLPENERDVLKNIDYLIFSTGAGILECRGGEIIRRLSLTLDQAKGIAQEMHEQRVDHMVHAPIPDTEHFIYSCYNSNNEDFHQRLKLYKEYGTPMSIDNWQKMAIYNGATEVLGVLPHKIPGHLMHTLQEKFSGFSVIRATSPLDHTSTWLEVFAEGVSKAQAADWLCRNINIDRDKTGSVGNDYNDEDMLDWSASSYVVENSPPSLKDNYTVVSSNNNSGVSEAIDNWLNS